MTGIQLQDNFSSVLYNVCGAVNLAISSMTDLQGTMGAEMNMASLDGAREQIDAATMALNEMNEAMQNASMPQTPAPEPFQWQSDTMPTFTGTGMERFQQEAQSANAMLQQLSSTQDSIARQAFQTTLLSPEAFQDMNSLAVRVDNLRDRIQAISENPVNMGTEQANSGLEQLRSQLNNAISQQNDLNDAMERGDVSGINSAYLELSRTVSNTERYIRDNTDEQGRFNQQIRDGTSASNGLMNSIKGIVAAYVSVQALGGVISFSDEIAQTMSRLNLMNDGTQTTSELFNAIYESAKNTHSQVMETADAVAKMGNNAGNAFSNNDELIAFMEQVNKQFVIGGASAQEQSNALLQLSQAMSAGALRGDELNSILDAAPGIARAIEQSMGWAEGSIKSYAEEGVVTAEVVKSSLLDMAEETNAAFESMPITFSQIMTDIQNDAIDAFQPVMQSLNEIANSEAFNSLVDTAIEGIATLANSEALQMFIDNIEHMLNILNSSGAFQGAVNGMVIAFEMLINIAMVAVDLLGSVAGFVADNWSVISPIIYGVVTALLMYLTYLGIVKAVEMVSTAIKIGMVIAEYAHAAATGTAVAATTAETAAQLGLNTALLACPITWIVLGIIALIAVIIAVANYIANTTDVAQSAFGVICGAVAVAGAFIFNNVIGIINAVIQAVWTIFVEPFIGIVEWVLNVANGGFDSFGGAVANLLGQIISWFLSLGKIVTKIIDAIFGTNWTAGLEGLQNSVLSWGKNENAITLDRNAPSFGNRIEYGAAFQAGANWGDSAADKLSGMFNKKRETDSKYEAGAYNYTGGGTGAGAGSGLGGDAAKTAANTGQTAANTAAIANSLDISNEQLKYLRDVAERDTVNRFTTAKIKVKMTNHNNVNSGMDLDGIVNGLTLAVEDAMSKAAEGVHI